MKCFLFLRPTIHNKNDATKTVDATDLKQHCHLKPSFQNEMYNTVAPHGVEMSR